MEIQCTTDYSIFKPFNEQRILRPRLTAKIQRSMKKRGFVPSHPITADKNMEVVDGQHRLRAAMNLGLCVYYVVVDKLGIDDIREMAQAMEKWSTDDYVTSNVRQGNQDYVRLLALKELSGLSWQAFLYASFADYSHTREDMFSGKFDLSEIKERSIMEFIERFELFKSPEVACKHWGHRFFVVACAQMFSHPKYDHEDMKQKITYQSSRLIKCVNAADYLDNLGAIYNYKRHAHTVVDFKSRGPRL